MTRRLDDIVADVGNVHERARLYVKTTKGTPRTDEWYQSFLMSLPLSEVLALAQSSAIQMLAAALDKAEDAQ